MSGLWHWLRTRSSPLERLAAAVRIEKRAVPQNSSWCEVWVDGLGPYVFFSWEEVQQFGQKAVELKGGELGEMTCWEKVSFPPWEGLPRRRLIWERAREQWKEDWPGVTEDRARERAILGAGVAIALKEEDEQRELMRRAASS